MYVNSIVIETNISKIKMTFIHIYKAWSHIYKASKDCLKIIVQLSKTIKIKIKRNDWANKNQRGKQCANSCEII